MHDFTITTIHGNKRHIEAPDADTALAIARVPEHECAQIEWYPHPDDEEQSACDWDLAAEERD